MAASVQLVDFSKVDDQRDPMPVPATFSSTQGALVMSRKQMRNRVRRNKKNLKRKGESPDFQKLYKPVSEWDMEELARGRPRDKNGNFGGLPPKWITRELHEESMTRFRSVIRDGMNAATPGALDVINEILKDDRLDDKDRPITPSSVRLSAATMLIEQVLGKPKQKIESDISVRMEGMLASVVITPDKLPAMPDAKSLTSPRVSTGVIDVDWEDD